MNPIAVSLALVRIGVANTSDSDGCKDSHN